MLDVHVHLVHIVRVMTEVQTKLAAYMADRQIDDAAVAAGVGCDRTMVSKLRRGKAVPSLKLAAEFKKWSGGALNADDFPIPSEAA